MNITDGILRISSSYGLKIPGSAPYSSEDEHVSISLEFPVEGEVDAILDKALVQEKILNAAVKLAVFEQLGVEFTEQAEGVIKPIIKPGPVAPASGKAQAAVAANVPQPGGGGQGGFGPPKVDPKTIPTFSASLNGIVVEVQDLRALKAAGVYKPNAADFRVGKQGYWLTAKDGSPDPLGSMLAAQADGASVL